MPKHVLLVDDDPLILRSSRRALERTSVEVVTAATLLQARACLETCRIDVALIDYFLGDGECGCDLIAPLRSRHRDIRIVILSGLAALPDVIQHALRAGADVVAGKTHADWVALVEGERRPPGRARPGISLQSLRCELIQGALLVHRRNISETARALGLKRSSLQRVLRRGSKPTPGEEE
jgi:ActR/RegA family two-component response regulator